jgi:hypothetical protein
MSHFEELLAASALTKFANQAQPILSSEKKESQTEKKSKGSRFPVQVRNQNIFQSFGMYSSHNNITFIIKH